MKCFKPRFLACTVAVLAMGFAVSATAYHEGGVGKCDGCHTTHNSSLGEKMSITGKVLSGNPYLLKGSDASSTCLNCHGTTDTTPASVCVCTTNAGVATLPGQRTPGGDFGWLTNNGLNSSDVVQAGNEATNRHGHHIVAADFNYLANTDNGGFAPGCTTRYPSAQLGCNSCHNPHNTATLDGSALPISSSGSYGITPAKGTALGVYRLLAGVGYNLAGTNTTFTYAAPVAVSPVNYNVPETTYTGTRVAYGSGMSEWCANCHDLMLINSYVLGSAGGGAITQHMHPAGNTTLLASVLSDGSNPANIYNAYVNTGNQTAADNTASYLSLVPYEMQDTRIASLSAAVGSTAGPTGGENVMCLSCHRAHASGFDSGARFDVSNQAFVTGPTGEWVYIGADSEPHPDVTGYYKAAYYDRPPSQFGLSQRTLCNKCHAKD